MTAAGIEADKASPMFRTLGGRGRKELTWRQDARRMIVRRALTAGIITSIGCHTFRATGITVYLLNGGLLEYAQQMPAHESARTTKSSLTASQTLLLSADLRPAQRSGHPRSGRADRVVNTRRPASSGKHRPSRPRRTCLLLGITAEARH